MLELTGDKRLLSELEEDIDVMEKQTAKAEWVKDWTEDKELARVMRRVTYRLKMQRRHILERLGQEKGG